MNIVTQAPQPPPPPYPPPVALVVVPDAVHRQGAVAPRSVPYELVLAVSVRHYGSVDTEAAAHAAVGCDGVGGGEYNEPVVYLTL